MSPTTPQQEWDFYFSRAFSTPLSVECSGLRDQLQDRADPDNNVLFGKVANFRVIDVAQGLSTTLSFRIASFQLELTLATAGVVIGAVQTHVLRGPGAAAGLDRILGMELPPKGMRIM